MISTFCESILIWIKIFKKTTAALQENDIEKRESPNAPIILTMLQMHMWTEFYCLSHCDEISKRAARAACSGAVRKAVMTLPGAPFWTNYRKTNLRQWSARNIVRWSGCINENVRGVQWIMQSSTRPAFPCRLEFALMCALCSRVRDDEAASAPQHTSKAGLGHGARDYSSSTFGRLAGFAPRACLLCAWCLSCLLEIFWLQGKGVIFEATDLLFLSQFCKVPSWKSWEILKTSILRDTLTCGNYLGFSAIPAEQFQLPWTF